MHSSVFQFSGFAILILFEKHTRANKFLLYSKSNDYVYKFNVSSFSSVKSQENLLRYSLNANRLPKQKTSWKKDVLSSHKTKSRRLKRQLNSPNLYNQKAKFTGGNFSYW